MYVVQVDTKGKSIREMKQALILYTNYYEHLENYQTTIRLQLDNTSQCEIHNIYIIEPRHEPPARDLTRCTQCTCSYITQKYTESSLTTNINYKYTSYMVTMLRMRRSLDVLVSFLHIPALWQPDKESNKYNNIGIHYARLHDILLQFETHLRYVSKYINTLYNETIM